MAYVTIVERGLVGSHQLCTISNQEIQRQIKLMCLTMLLVEPETLEDLEHIQTQGSEYLILIGLIMILAKLKYDT